MDQKFNADALENVRDIILFVSTDKNKKILPIVCMTTQEVIDMYFAASRGYTCWNGKYGTFVTNLPGTNMWINSNVIFKDIAEYGYNTFLLVESNAEVRKGEEKLSDQKCWSPIRPINRLDLLNEKLSPELYKISKEELLSLNAGPKKPNENEDPESFISNLLGFQDMFSHVREMKNNPIYEQDTDVEDSEDDSENNSSVGKAIEERDDYYSEPPSDEEEEDENHSENSSDE